MLFWTVLCLAVLCSQSLGADHTSVADEFNDALDEGLQSVRVLIQNTESHLPSAVNKAFDYLNRLQDKPNGDSVAEAANALYETAKNTITQVSAETEAVFSKLSVLTDQLKLPQNILQLIADHHSLQDFLIKEAREAFSQTIRSHRLGSSKADEKLASFLQQKTNAIKQAVTSIGSAVHDVIGHLQNSANSSLSKESVENVLSSGMKTLGSAVIYAQEEIKDAMSH